jgi:hypothetical protein
MCAIINSEELIELNQMMIKQLKNRYRDLNMTKRFVIGVDRKYMKLYDVENSAQLDIVDSGQDTSEFDYKSKFAQPKKSFEGFKV